MARVTGLFISILLLGTGCSDGEAPVSVDRDALAQPQAEAPGTALVDEARIANIETAEPGAWLTYGRNYEEQRFSPLTEINRETVEGLGIAWFKDLDTYHPVQGTPLVIDGTLYFSTPFNIVYAVDAGTGEELWKYDPEVPKVTRRQACCGANARGIAAYKGRIYTATLDGRLIALDAATGARVWETDTIIDRTREYTITGAPRVAAGKVFIGNGGAEYGVRGYVTAYDADTGKQAWRFFTVPGNPAEPFEHPEMEMAAETWKGGQWWEIGGGGTVWNSIVYDPDFNHVYLGVGNGSPWTRVIRSPGGGDNLFLASIVAVDADTGRMQWYYQTTPGDNWDYTAVQDMMLADIEIDGEVRKVLMQAPKNGFFYVIDRRDGKLLRAHQFATVTWATHVDLDTGRPVENEDTVYLENPQWILPGPSGAHNWHAMSYDASRRLVYFGSHDLPFLYAMPEEYQKSGFYKRRENQFNLGVEFGRIDRMIRESENPPVAAGFLNALDPVTGEKKWVVDQAFPMNGGVLATAGDLVFQGTQTGELVARDSDTGDALWSESLHSSIVAPPITYEHDGKQHIAILTGAGGGAPGSADDLYGSTGRLVVLTLGSDSRLPEPMERDLSFPEPPPLTASAADLDRGEVLFGDLCGICHAPGGFAGSGGIPDLRRMTPETHAQWTGIVLGGSKRDLGMDSFADVLNMEDAERIRQFLISATIAARSGTAPVGAQQ
jgi:quinohemoprotein ethanol dehydrogenase